MFTPFKELPNYAPWFGLSLSLGCLPGLWMWEATPFDGLFEKDRPDATPSLNVRRFYHTLRKSKNQQQERQ